MLWLSLVWLIILPLVPIVLRVRRKRFALLWIIITYIILVFGAAVIPSFIELYQTGAGDPEMIAGKTSQKLVTSVLVGFINIPLALLGFWVLRRFVFK